MEGNKGIFANGLGGIGGSIFSPPSKIYQDDFDCRNNVTDLNTTDDNQKQNGNN